MTRIVGVVASLLGYFVRVVLILLRHLPSFLAFFLIAYGIYLYDPRAAFIAMGLMLLVLTATPSTPKDRREM